MTKWNNILPSMMKVAFGFLGFKAYASFGKNEITERNENFQNLHDYILYLQTNVTGRRLRNTNFDKLRNIMGTEYPAEQVYF